MTTVDIAPPGRVLRSHALAMRDVVGMALASSGPTQSIAVSLAAITAASGYAGVLPVFLCLIPMLGIAIGYQRRNAGQMAAGATGAWVGRANSPIAGLFSGWIMLLSSTVGTTSLAIPLGTHLLSLVNTSLPNNTMAVGLAGTGLDLLVLTVAAVGIRACARFQGGWAVFEHALLVAFAILALVNTYGRHLVGAVQASPSWFHSRKRGASAAWWPAC